MEKWGDGVLEEWNDGLGGMEFWNDGGMYTVEQVSKPANYPVNGMNGEMELKVLLLNYFN